MLRKITLYIFLFFYACNTVQLWAQGLTTSTLSGFVFDENEMALEGATIELQHIPSATNYQSLTQANGQFFLSSLKIGGPYTLKITHLGFEEQVLKEIILGLGQSNSLQIMMVKRALALDEVQVKAPAQVKDIATSITTNIHQEELSFLPNIERSILDFTRLNPQANLAGFAGKGSRDNFVSIDGSAFNNVYGLGGNSALLIGNVVGAQPLSLDAIEAIQVNLSPFDVRQRGFTGAGIHAVTKSGDNNFRATVYSFFRNENFVGQKIDGQDLPLSDFNQNIFGASLSGPLIKNKLFYFVNYERERRTSPATDFIANRDGLNGDNVTRVSAKDLEELSTHLNSTYGYSTGPYEAYEHQSQNDKLLLKLNWNINLKHQLVLRYNQLNARQDFPASNSASFGAGNRVDNLFSMAYENSGGTRKVNARSLVAEWNSFLSPKMTNRFIGGFSHFPDSREIKGDLFPSVDILKENRTYISFGSHLFASHNSVQQNTYYLQDELSLYLGGHRFTAGWTWEYFQFDHSFIPANAGSFVFNSLEDFYNSAPENTNTPIGISNGMGKPSAYARSYTTSLNNASSELQTKFSQFGAFLQDEYQYKQLKIVGGIRIDVYSFPQSPMSNPTVSQLDFQDEDGNTENFKTDELPATTSLFSPRLGFNWTISKKRGIQLRGGTGIFTGRSPLIRIADQYANNGLLLGEIKAKNNAANQYPFSPDPNAYIPEDRTAANTYDLNFTVPGFKMPQVWKSTLGIDYKLPLNIVASLDLIYSDDLHRDYVRNANLDHADKGNSKDGRFVFSNSKLNNPPVLAAYVLDNTNKGEQFHISFQLKKQYNKNWFASLAYTYGYAKDVNSFSASNSRIAYRSLPVLGNTNQAVLAYSDDHQAHRVVGAASYRIHYGNFGATTFSLFLDLAQRGRFSYTYSGKGDVNKDGVPNNDLIFVPTELQQIELEAYMSNGKMISVEEQWQALDGFIENSDYLSQRRGQFAERNGSQYPTFFQLDIRLLQDFYFRIAEKKHTIQLSLDLINFNNLLHHEWGNRKIVANKQPIEASQNGKFRVNPSLLDTEFLTDTGLSSRWQMQLGLRYIFN